MRAAYYKTNGSASEVLKLGELVKPGPERGDVVVRMAFSGVNPSDVKARAGRPLNGEFQIPHSDGAGIIDAVGEGVDASRKGERVWIWNAAWKRAHGTCCEYLVIPEEQAVSLPDAVSFETGACLGIPGLTAAHGINLLKSVGADRVLITGAASSVGHYAAQMASRSGMRVIGTASEKRKQAALNAGCERVIDYRSEDFSKAVIEAAGGPVDAILDMDFSSTSGLLTDGVLKSHGAYFCYGSNNMDEGRFDFRTALFNSLTFRFFLVYELTAPDRLRALETLNQALAMGLETQVASIFELERIVEAHEAVESGETIGNVLIRL